MTYTIYNSKHEIFLHHVNLVHLLERTYNNNNNDNNNSNNTNIMIILFEEDGMDASLTCGP